MVNQTSSQRITRRRSSKHHPGKRMVGLQPERKTPKPILAIDTSLFHHAIQPSQQQQGSLRVGTQPRGVIDIEPSNDKGSQGPEPSLLDVDGMSPVSHSINFGLAIPVQQARGPATYPSQPTVSGMATPTVVITPADENAPMNSLHAPNKRCRVPSSVYSRHTDFEAELVDDEFVPPIPAIPAHWQDSMVQVGSAPSAAQRRAQDRAAATSVCTIFGEDQGSPASMSSLRLRSKQVSTTPVQPTPPRDSRGWWSFITSPFSARSNVSFWRSPISSHEDCLPILRDIQGVPSKIGPADTHEAGPLGRDIKNRLSVTSIDIYHIPYTGEAATYYDRSRHFPSIILHNGPALMQSIFINDTPMSARPTVEGVEERSDPGDVSNPRTKPCGVGIIDGHERPLFASPHADELSTPSAIPVIPAGPANDQQGGNTPDQPIDVARSISAPGEKKPVVQSDSPPRYTHGLAANTMACRSVEEPISTPAYHGNLDITKPHHNRTSSYGLGIISGEEAEPISSVLEKPRQEHARISTSEGWSRKLRWPLIIFSVITMILIVTLLVIYVPQKRQDIAVQAQWVNLTGFPAMAVGITTIVQPKLVRNVDKCASSGQLWSCPTVKGQIQGEIRSNSTLPDFRLEIRFRNDSSLNNSMLQTQHVKRSGPVVTAGSSIRSLVRRDYWSDNLFDASPAVPSLADQIFLGNTTDNNTAPFEGEATPFYISILDAKALSSGKMMQKRDNQVYPLPQADNSTIESTSSLPKALGGPDGKAVVAPFPLASAQPLRLFKRGLPDEHYGFYIYYDRSVLASGNDLANTSRSNSANNPSVLCIWSQSRFLVQIWTRSLLSKGTASHISGSSADVQSVSAMNSTANVMDAPGSFPYPVSITVDRHGGDAVSKGAFCYPLNTNGQVQPGTGTWIAEDRAYGGALVNAAPVPGSNATHASQRDEEGGIDGGIGGCACAWQNW